jgi:hypothetical protein
MVTGYLGACYPFFCEESDTPYNEPDDNDLWSISGRSPKDIWAAGSLLPDASATIVQNLLEHHNGTSWSVVPTRELGSEANFCAAGGYCDGKGYTRSANTWKVASGHLVTTATGKTADAFPLAVVGSAAGPWVGGNERAGIAGSRPWSSLRLEPAELHSTASSPSVPRTSGLSAPMTVTEE